MTETTEMTVRRSVRVPCEPAKAFALFTERMADFWPRDHSIGDSPQAAVVVEPHVGGRWYERGEDGVECRWGRVVEWAPPHRLVLTWQITAEWRYDPDFETLVELHFTPEPDGGCLVTLAHRHLERFGDRADAMYEVFDSAGGWAGTMTAFTRVAG
ncbi:uncharacterized protein YndB with AHSA1/START domain [Stackebrandtia albiflava]|uniref:Uncharacterized protein YndB with AHSA1/START domain n=1 Tax=Stackebrandtia albiflava TaxID=406432 RepID=A0A562VCA6_9ACTN|nr:SRPBCC family protein [Stackebrandtia albiflava]TWJ15488.1 uncharacterized protein YndB with AHSA1/START domain [Stackebrandtia albiflava]